MKLKWNFKTCQKETKMIAVTIRKAVGLGDKDVHTSQGSLPSPSRFAVSRSRTNILKRRWGSLHPARRKELQMAGQGLWGTSARGSRG